LAFNVANFFIQLELAELEPSEVKDVFNQVEEELAAGFLEA